MLTSDNRVEFVITQFSGLERQLTECMEFLPFIEHNMKVVSPKFIPLILEACSIIDSVFKEITGDGEKKLNLRAYAKLNEDRLELEETISIFLGSPIRFYQPYKAWTERTPSWWGAYNRLKHHRLSNYEFATYESAVLSLAALHQLISKSRVFTDSLIKAGWCNPSTELLGELIIARISDSGIPASPIACESQLFVSPLDTNFVSLENGEYVVEECDFSQRVKVLLAMLQY